MTRIHPPKEPVPPDSRLKAIRERDPRHAIGLVSGTSADGVDAALVRLSGSGPTLRVETIAFLAVPYPSSVRSRVLAAPSLKAAEIAALSMEIGEIFAEAASGVARLARLDGLEVDFVGSHGQTLFHRPRHGKGAAATLQVGEPAIIAHRLGCVVVSDFRAADVVAGGEGAPLVPLLDRLVFAPLGRPVVALNLGGIANVTLVRGQETPVIAFDTGPANSLLDTVARRELGAAHDRDGREAAKGSIQPALLSRWLEHPYFELPPPKSTGRETWGDAFVDDVRDQSPSMSTADLLATLAAFTAESIGLSLDRFVAPHATPTEIVASGGGVHNATLMEALRRRLEPVPIRSSASYGIDPDAKEAVLFAVIANETIHGRPGNRPEATGAAAPVVLGRITL